MSDALSSAIDLDATAHHLGLPAGKVRETVELLDAGNTVPFITRYRKDQTGGLDEVQIRRIQEEVTRRRLLEERKGTILRSIESRGKLTPELAAAIQKANSTKVLEDIYLPYKPKKQTLATLARERGLEPLADEVQQGDSAALDLEADHEAASAASVLFDMRRNAAVVFAGTTSSRSTSGRPSKAAQALPASSISRTHTPIWSIPMTRPSSR